MAAAAAAIPDDREETHVRDTISTLTSIFDTDRAQFELRCLGICHRCSRQIAKCSCNNTVENTANYIFEFLLNGRETDNDLQRHYCVAILSLLGEPTLPSIKISIMLCQPSLQIACDIFTWIVDNQSGPIYNERALENTIHLLCRAGLTLGTRVGRGETALCYACHKYEVVPAFLAVTTDDADDRNSHGQSALFIACDSEAPSETIELLIARSNDDTLNDEISPFFRSIEVFMHRLKESHSYYSNNELETIRIFLRAARDDGSGVNLFKKNNGLTPLEYAKQLSAVVKDTGIDAMRAARLLVDELTVHQEHVRQRQKQFMQLLISTLQGLILVRPLIDLVHEYLTPRPAIEMMNSH